MSRRKCRPWPPGVLVIAKPRGMTSRRADDLLARAYGRPRIGHLGTLDPFATGVLPVLLGEASKYAPFLAVLPKAYEAAIRLGVTTDTLDADGAESGRAPVAPGWDLRLADIARQFTGELMQVPPLVSAVKVGGERAYDLARRGETTALPARAVTVHCLRLRALGETEMAAEIVCGSGFYVRALARDLATALGTVGHVAALRRTWAAGFSADEAVPLDEALNWDAAAAQARAHGPRRALAHLDQVTLGAAAAAEVRHGLVGRAARADITAASPPPGPLAAFEPAGELVAILDVHPGGDVGIHRGFAPYSP